MIRTSNQLLYITLALNRNAILFEKLVLSHRSYILCLLVFYSYIGRNATEPLTLRKHKELVSNKPSRFSDIWSTVILEMPSRWSTSDVYSLLHIRSIQERKT